MKETEKTIEQYLVKGIDALGGIAYKLVSPNRRFVADRLCILPKGLVYFVEVKGPKGRLHSGQQREMNRLLNLGQQALVVRSKQDVNELLDEMGERINAL